MLRCVFADIPYLLTMHAFYNSPKTDAVRTQLGCNEHETLTKVTAKIDFWGF